MNQPSSAASAANNTSQHGRFWDVDLKALIPVILFLITQMIVGATWISSISSRLAIREAMVDPTMKRIEKLEAERETNIRFQEQLKSLSVAIEKLAAKLDGFHK
jgi:hypothetical protein